MYRAVPLPGAHYAEREKRVKSIVRSRYGFHPAASHYLDGVPGADNIPRQQVVKEVVIMTRRHSAPVRFLISRFDFIFRFLYCRAGLFRIINALHPKIYHSDYESLNGYFEVMIFHLDRLKFEISGKSVLELGPGNSYINAYNFLHRGARNMILVDKYPRYSESEKQKSFIRRERDYFKSLRQTERCDYLDGKTCEPDPRYIRFMAGDLCDLDVGEQVDFIYSIAVLQHIRDLPRYIRKMSDLLREGGMAFHAVDLKDKFHFFGNPFLFYKYSDRVWDRFLTEESVTYTNRLRYREYVDLFAANGFELVWESVLEYDVPPVNLARRFAGRDDLHVGDAQFLLRKK